MSLSTSSLMYGALLSAVFAVGVGFSMYGRKEKGKGGAVIALGTKNKCKVSAVQKTLSLYPRLGKAEIVPRSVQTGVSEQPIGVETVATGARNRAEAAFKEIDVCDYAIGIESGLFKLNDETYYDVCVCSIFDGRSHKLGFSCAFEIPKKIMEFVRKGNDLSQACNKANITSDESLGENQGLIGILTKGRVTREEYTIQAVKMACNFMENEKWF